MSAPTTYSGLERRKFPRIPIREDVMVMFAGRRIGGTSRDVSGGGISFSIEIDADAWGRALRRGLIQGARLRLFFDLPTNDGSKRPANMLSSIVRIEPDEELNTVEISASF